MIGWQFGLRAPRPALPVPALQLDAAAGVSARLMPVRADLVPVAARIGGRAAAGPDGGYRHEWPGFYAEAQFQGPEIWLRFDDALNRWRVSLDGTSIALSRPGRQDLHIAGLSPGPHVIRAETTSEAGAPTLFGGFFLADGGLGLPPPAMRARLIEFIGDSDTVGFASTAERRDCTPDEIFSATDTSRAYPVQVAQALGADYRVVARSGIGLLRNYGGADSGRSMPALYPLTLPGSPQATGMAQRPADTLVIALGSNDFGSDFASGEPWADKTALAEDFGPALLGFARDRLAENPDATLILLAFGEYGPDMTGAYQFAADALRAEGRDLRLVVLPAPQRNACLWHLSQDDHAMIARSILSALEQPRDAGIK